MGNINSMIRIRICGVSFHVVVALMVVVGMSSCNPDKRGQTGSLFKGEVDTTVSYYHQVAPIIANNCLGCHSEKGPGPINLTSFANVRFNAEMIRYVINRHIMPPWLADEQGWDFANKRGLAKNEIEIINKWIDKGQYKGDSLVVSPTPKMLNSERRKPDLVLHLNKNFFVHGNNTESFQKASFSFQIDSTFPVEAIEIVSKQMKVAHHASYVIKGQSNFSRSSEEFLLGNDLFKDSSVVMIGGWLPGTGAVRFPEGYGFYLPQKGEVDLEFHYTPSPVDLIDSAEIHIYKSTSPIKRTCTFLAIANDDSDCVLTPKPFQIEADQKRKFTIQYRIKQDLTVLAVTPHMHYLGKKYRASVADINGHISTIINLDNWKFSQQDQYLCKTFHKLAKGDNLIIEGEFDNTKSNLQNPNSPPQLVRPGWGARSEMLVLILMVTKYMPGDEKTEWATPAP